MEWDGEQIERNRKTEKQGNIVARLSCLFSDHSLTLSVV